MIQHRHGLSRKQALSFITLNSTHPGLGSFNSRSFDTPPHQLSALHNAAFFHKQSTQSTAKMDVTYFSNEFPKEDLATLLRHLQNHSKRSEHPLLAEFLSEASLAVKDEVRKLPVELRWELPPLENFLSWAEQPSLREGPLCGESMNHSRNPVRRDSMNIYYSLASSWSVRDIAMICNLSQQHMDLYVFRSRPLLTRLVFQVLWMALY